MDLELSMDSPAIPVFLAGPFPVLHAARIDAVADELELDVGLLIGGAPTIIASTAFPIDETWERVRTALRSGDARLGVAGMPHESETVTGVVEVYPSAYVGLECANGERLVLSHIRGIDAQQNAESYARSVIDSILRGHTPAELGELLEE
jgi:hypothetical protein